MCAIVGSFDKDKLIELIKLNSYRGSHSFSVTMLDSIRIRVVEKAFGEVDIDKINIGPGEYCIVHIQAPTTSAKDHSNIHPAQEEYTYLWHNGIIKAEHVKKMQAAYGNDINWDTELLLRAVNTSTDGLNEVDGSFSCLWYNGAGAFLFRNDISPMFIDDDLNISSTKFAGSRPTPANTILGMDIESKTLYNKGSFKTVYNPYYFGD